MVGAVEAVVQSIQCFFQMLLVLCLRLFGLYKMDKLQEAGIHLDGMNFAAAPKVAWKYRSIDLEKFTAEHWRIFEQCQKSSDHAEAVMHYYEVMADVITMGCGPYWHFTPLRKQHSRLESHEIFHQTMASTLNAKKGHEILELGAGYGECGRRVAFYSGANVTSLTLADCEIVGGTERIKAAGLEKQCKMVQGNYHNMKMFPDNSFDAIFAVYTLKYSADLEKVMKEVYRILKPGGKFVNYCVLFDEDRLMELAKSHTPEWEKDQRKAVANISTATGMPPLWPKKAYETTGKKVGFVKPEHVDIYDPKNDLEWWHCFDGACPLLTSPFIFFLVRLAESLHICGRGFSKFYETFLVHPTVDFVKTGQVGVVQCSLMMTWRKP